MRRSWCAAGHRGHFKASSNVAAFRRRQAIPFVGIFALAEFGLEGFRVHGFIQHLLILVISMGGDQAPRYHDIPPFFNLVNKEDQPRT